MNRPVQPNTTLTIVAACLATAMLMLDISVINTALSDIADGLDTGLSGLQWLVDAYTIPLAATVLTAGAIADRLGRRRLFIIGLAIFTVSSALCGAAGGIEVLVGSRAIQGLGASMMFATALALISQVTPDRESRTKALAAYGAAIGASFALGPFIGGGLTELFGWRAIFLVNVPIGAAVLWITFRAVAEGRDPTPRRIDVPGQLTLIGGLFLLVLALLRGNEEGWGSTGIVAALAGAAVLLIAFVVVEQRSREPMLPLRLMGDRRFAGAQVAVFAIAASFFAVFLYLTLYLQTVLGMSPIETGLVYLPGTFLVFVVSGMTAQLGAKFSPAKIASIGLALVAVGLALMLFAGVDSSWTVLLPGLLVTSAGTGLFNPTGSALALNALPAEQSGLAAGANDTFRQTGVAVGIAALGTLVPANAALGGDLQSYVDGLHHALIASAVLAAAGAIITAWLLLPVRQEAEAEAEVDRVDVASGRGGLIAGNGAVGRSRTHRRGTKRSHGRVRSQSRDRGADGVQVLLQSVVTGDGDYLVARARGRHPERVAVALDHENGDRDRVELALSRLGGIVGLAGWVHREGQTKHGRGVGLRRGAAGDPGAHRPPAGDQGVGEHAALAQVREHREPGGVELPGRRRGLAARDAVGLLDQHDVEPGLARHRGGGRDVDRLDSTARAVAERQGAARLRRRRHVGAGRPVRGLDLDRFHRPRR